MDLPRQGLDKQTDRHMHKLYISNLSLSVCSRRSMARKVIMTGALGAIITGQIRDGYCFQRL